jgi:hypothetical protein
MLLVIITSTCMYLNWIEIVLIHKIPIYVFPIVSLFYYKNLSQWCIHLQYLVNSILPFIHTDTNECTLGTHDCANVAACQNTRGSYICVCPAGYFGDGRVCTGMLDQKHFLVYTQHRQHGTKKAVRFLLFGGHVVSK